MPAEQIAAQRAADEKPVLVQEWNWPIVRVFMLCRMQVAISMAGKHPVGIDAVEIQTICGCIGLPFDEETLFGIRHMTGHYCAVKEKQIEAAATRLRSSRPRSR